MLVLHVVYFEPPVNSSTIQDLHFPILRLNKAIWRWWWWWRLRHKIGCWRIPKSFLVHYLQSKSSMRSFNTEPTRFSSVLCRPMTPQNSPKLTAQTCNQKVNETMHNQIHSFPKYTKLSTAKQTAKSKKTGTHLSKWSMESERLTACNVMKFSNIQSTIRMAMFCALHDYIWSHTINTTHAHMVKCCVDAETVLCWGLCRGCTGTS